jgi:hypothetical protein
MLVRSLAGSSLVLLVLLLGDAGAEAPAPTGVADLLLGPEAPRHLVCGHRGAHQDTVLGDAGNTWPAFRRAVRAGADMVEADVETTSDAWAVVVHDPWPRSRTLEQCRRRRRGLVVLRDLLSWAKGRVVVVLDVKSPRVELVVGVVRRTQTVEHVIFFTDSLEEYEAVRGRGDDLYVMGRALDVEGARAWVTRRQEDPRIVLLHGDYDWLHGDVNDWLRREGLRTYANSWKLSWDSELFGSRGSVYRVFRRGIDVAQTNDPAGGVVAREQILRRRGR